MYVDIVISNAFNLNKPFFSSSFVPLSVSLCNDLGDPLFDGVGLAAFKSRANAFLLA